MIKIIISLIVLVIIGAGAFWYINNTRSAGTINNTADEDVAIENSTNIKRISGSDFHRGVLVRPYALGEYSKADLTSQIMLAKELGASDVRANIESSAAINDDFVSIAIENGLNPVLIIEPSLPDFFNTASYDLAYSLASDYAIRYKNKVKYYQLANEASGVNIKPSYPGDKKTDYDDQKYAVFLNWIKGLSNGIFDNDPSAKRIITANWLGVGIIDRLVDDGVHFEIVGWNWYDDMGSSLVKKDSDGKTLNIPQYLSKYNKEFWVIEINRHKGTLDNDFNAQSTYLANFINYAADEKLISGIFIFPLTDMCNLLDKSEGRMGLVSVNKKTVSVCTIGDKKPAFTTVQKYFIPIPK